MGLIETLLVDDDQMALEYIEELIDWEAAWAESSTAFIIAIIAAVVVSVIVIGIIKNKSAKTVKEQYE